MSLTEAQMVHTHPLVKRHREIMTRLTKRHTLAYGPQFMTDQSGQDTTERGVKWWTEAEQEHYEAIGKSYRAACAWVRRNLRKS